LKEKYPEFPERQKKITEMWKKVKQDGKEDSWNSEEEVENLRLLIQSQKICFECLQVNYFVYNKQNNSYKEINLVL